MEEENKRVIMRKVKIKPKEEVLKRFDWQFHDSCLSLWYEANKFYKVDDSTWDYGILDKKTHELVMLVQIDWDGEECLFIPDDKVKVFFIYQEDFIGCFKAMFEELVPEYDDLVMEVFLECREGGFPYKSYSNQEMISDLQGLIKLKDTKSISTRNNNGDKVIQNFHRSIWSAHNNGSQAPIEAWEDDDLLIKVIENRFLYRNIINPGKILQGLNITKSAGKVSVFSAGRAKLIIDKYLSEFDTVFDPFSGFSGRMLGTWAAGKRYIGQDLSPTHVAESNKIIEFLKQTETYWQGHILPEVTQANVFDSYGEYPCLFTCSPYADKEWWVDVEPDKHTCDDWIGICMEHFKCQRYVFVVDKTDKYRDNIVEDVINKSHFNTNIEKVLVIDK